MFDFLDGFYLVLHSNYIYLNNPLKNETIRSKKFLSLYTCKKLLEEEVEFFDFSSVNSVSSEAVLASQWNSQQLPVIGGIAIPELEIKLAIVS